MEAELEAQRLVRHLRVTPNRASPAVTGEVMGIAVLRLAAWQEG